MPRLRDTFLQAVEVVHVARPRWVGGPLVQAEGGGPGGVGGFRVRVGVRGGLAIREKEKRERVERERGREALSGALAPFPRLVRAPFCPRDPAGSFSRPLAGKEGHGVDGLPSLHARGKRSAQGPRDAAALGFFSSPALARPGGPRSLRGVPRAHAHTPATPQSGGEDLRGAEERGSRGESCLLSGQKKREADAHLFPPRIAAPHRPSPSHAPTSWSSADSWRA